MYLGFKNCSMTNGEEGGVNQNKPPTDPPFSKQHPQDVFLGPGKPLLARRSRFTPPPAPPTDSQPAPAVPPAPSSTPTPPRSAFATTTTSSSHFGPLFSSLLACFVHHCLSALPASFIRSFLHTLFSPDFLRSSKWGWKGQGGERKRRTKRAAAAAVVNFFAGCFIAAPALPTIFITCSALAEPPMKMSVCMPRRLAAAGVCVCVRGAPLGKKGNL